MVGVAMASISRSGGNGVTTHYYPSSPFSPASPEEFLPLLRDRHAVGYFVRVEGACGRG